MKLYRRGIGVYGNIDQVILEEGRKGTLKQRSSPISAPSVTERARCLPGIMLPLLKYNAKPAKGKA